jgi:type IV pilus assembly protein PilA
MVGAMQPPYPPGPPYPPPQQAPPQQAPAKKGMSGCVIALIVAAVLAVPTLGIVASLGIYGVRRYLASAKTAEAKNTIGAIARGAVAAYERETLVGTKTVQRLCDSATPVPRTVPAATKYQPSSATGSDFQTGSADAGWMCLKFSMSYPMYYQYRYDKGAGSGKTGATANGFEASARGDLDNNGTTSFFGRGGTVRNGSLVLDTSIIIENEFE